MRYLLTLVTVLLVTPTHSHDWFTDTRTVEPWPSIEAAERGQRNDWLHNQHSVEEFHGPSQGQASCCGGDDCLVYEVEERQDGMYFPELDYTAPWWRIQPSKDGTWRACVVGDDPYPRCVFGPPQSF